jgi:AcrR family transcriptional regulator
MPRPVNHARRQALAREAFAILRAAPAGLTMTQLAVRLGLKRPTLYYYFADTAAIADAAAADLLTRLHAHLVTRLVGRHHPVDFLDAWVEAVRTFFAASPADLALHASVLAQADSRAGAAGAAAARLEAHVRPIEDSAVRTLRDGLARGLVEPCDPEAVVALVSATLHGALLAWHTQGREPDMTLGALWSLALAPLRIPRLVTEDTATTAGGGRSEPPGDAIA